MFSQTVSDTIPSEKITPYLTLLKSRQYPSTVILIAQNILSLVQTYKLSLSTLRSLGMIYNLTLFLKNPPKNWESVSVDEHLVCSRLLKYNSGIMARSIDANFFRIADSGCYGGYFGVVILAINSKPGEQEMLCFYRGIGVFVSNG